MAHYRDQVCLFKREQSNSLKGLDLATENIMNAIIEQRDMFIVAHDTQITFMRTLHTEMMSRIKDEHAITRREVLQEIRVRTRFVLSTTSIALTTRAGYKIF